VFAGTAIKRVGRDRFVRNILIAIGNSGDPMLSPAAERLLEDASPLVRAMAVWALSRLVTPPAFATLRTRHISEETDEDVRREWENGCAVGRSSAA
jgi:epoxyqueuosine reductase